VRSKQSDNFFIAVSVIEALDTAFLAVVGLLAGLLAGMKGAVVVE
jgi:hypothetical protein